MPRDGAGGLESSELHEDVFEPQSEGFGCSVGMHGMCEDGPQQGLVDVIELSPP